MSFIMDYHRLNQKSVRKPYPLPTIGETIQQLQVFQYATELDLNMGYYTIRIFPASQDMTTTVSESGGCKYNRLLMSMCALVYILQAKVDELLGDIEGVKIYIDDILVLRNEIFSRHIQQPRFIFAILRAAGLKVNALK